MTKHVVTATVYDKRGRILAVKDNDYQKTHPKQARLAQACGLHHKQYLHAEISAIIKAQKHGVPYKIKVERYDHRGRPALAKPCPICEMAIAESGIKFVEFTVG